MKPYHELTEQEKMIEIFKHAHQMSEVAEDTLLNLSRDDREQRDMTWAASEFYSEMTRDIEARLDRLGIERDITPRSTYRP